jgi:hypothetical protein
MRNVKSPKITRLARLAISEDQRSLIEKQTRELESPSIPCGDPDHTDLSKAERVPRFREAGTRYFILGETRCPACKQSTNSGQSPYPARLAGREFPSVCVLSSERIKAELDSVTLSQHNLVPRFSTKDYRSPNPGGRWFAGCPASLPPADPHEKSILWVERHRSYARGIALTGVLAQRVIHERKEKESHRGIKSRL